MTAEQTLKNEIETAKTLIEQVAEIIPTLQAEYPTWVNVGDAKRFNELLKEIIEIYK